MENNQIENIIKTHKYKCKKQNIFIIMVNGGDG